MTLFAGVLFLSALFLGWVVLSQKAAEMEELRGAEAGAVLPSLVVAAISVGIVAWFGGAVAEGLRQPRVIGEMATGILIGSVIMARPEDALLSWMFHPAVVFILDALGSASVALFMFTVGALLTTDSITKKDGGLKAVSCSVIVMAVPLVIGATSGVFLYDPAVTRAPWIAFLIFVGVVFATTAFPVLARILSDHKLLGTRLGALSMMAAGMNDVVVWILLVVATVIVEDRSAAEILISVVLMLGGVVVILAFVRPFLAFCLGLVARASRFLLAIALASYAFTLGFVFESIGSSAIIGAFLAGLSLPRRRDSIRAPIDCLRNAAMPLLPIFFVVAGIYANVGIVLTADGLKLVSVITLAAASSKILAGVLSARYMGFTWRESAGVGVLMNCRGVTELVVLHTGRTAGLVDDRYFGAFFLMAVISTAMTSPLLTCLKLRY